MNLLPILMTSVLYMQVHSTYCLSTYVCLSLTLIFVRVCTEPRVEDHSAQGEGCVVTDSVIP